MRGKTPPFDWDDEIQPQRRWRLWKQRNPAADAAAAAAVGCSKVNQGISSRTSSPFSIRKSMFFLFWGQRCWIGRRFAFIFCSQSVKTASHNKPQEEDSPVSHRAKWTGTCGHFVHNHVTKLPWQPAPSRRIVVPFKMQSDTKCCFIQTRMRFNWTIYRKQHVDPQCDEKLNEMRK